MNQLNKIINAINKNKKLNKKSFVGRAGSNRYEGTYKFRKNKSVQSEKRTKKNTKMSATELVGICYRTTGSTLSLLTHLLEEEEE
ncbi:hypothetical protein NQ318_018337 [Aromia moschata]|uniref:Uncharacterized protein n=1 Tax=Aromia moschata TaxID=1265417 RepID=A0AAV8ZGK0_9CUCU|nr:hypothetical protein NQ318_018337 [Aromia moschata]